MGELQTWRDLLGAIIEDPQERSQIAHAINVHQITLARWVLGTSSPRLRSLRILLDALPEQREQLLQLMALDYPELLHEDLQEEEEQLQIPALFYANVMEIYTHNPTILRSSILGITILQQMLAQLDPQQMGMGIFIAKCMPLSSGKVRSVRAIIARGTGIWKKIEHLTSFHGIESQIGHTVQDQRPILTQSSEERATWYPPTIPNAQSVAAFPIQIADCVAGGVGLISGQAEYFSGERLDLVHAYAEMLALLFKQDQFYLPKQIEMNVMPSYRIQQTVLASFQQRVKQRIVEAMYNQELLPRPQAELEVWQELEDILLHMHTDTWTTGVQ